MSLLVQDALSGRLVEVGQEGKVGLYVCGPTVYNHIHIGNARGPLFWDVVARYLRSRGYQVTFIQNITDIDDKIINRANEEGVSWEQIVRRYTDSFHERLKMLRVGFPDVEPRATQHIPEMISLIQELIENGYAYSPDNGDVYYDVASYPRYGQLSKQRPDEMRETERRATGKMAKSLGNILDVKRAVELHGRNALRMWFLQGHYSQPIVYSEGILEEKKRSYERLQNLYARIAGSTSSSDLDESLLAELRERFDAAMRNDFNTPEAIAALFEAAKRAGQEISAHPNSMREFAGLKKTFEELLGEVLGFELSEDQMVYVPSVPGDERFGETTVMLGPGPEVKEKVDRREQARQQKDWTIADQLRDELRAEGWSIEDTPQGPVLIRR